MNPRPPTSFPSPIPEFVKIKDILKTRQANELVGKSLLPFPFPLSPFPFIPFSFSLFPFSYISLPSFTPVLYFLPLHSHLLPVPCFLPFLLAHSLFVTLPLYLRSSLLSFSFFYPELIMYLLCRCYCIRERFIRFDANKIEERE